MALPVPRERDLGAVLGAILIIGLQGATYFLQGSPELLQFFSSIRWTILGLAMLIVLRWRPQGIVPERPVRVGAGPPEPAPAGAREEGPHA